VRVRSTVAPATATLLRKKTRKLVSAKRREKFPRVGWSGTKRGVAKISPDGLRAVESIQRNGKAAPRSSTAPAA
jgi:hypothetical protein